jgi:RimJ/RimL family protein N-acetyltransferase
MVALTDGRTWMDGALLSVRRPSFEDLDSVFAVHGDARTNVHNPAGPDRDRDASCARFRGWLDHWNEHGFGYWVVELLDGDHDPTVVGFTGVQHAVWLGRPVLNLYYRYGADHWGHGYATTGARHAIAWAAEHLPSLPVLACTTLENIASQRTAVAAGLVRRPDLEVTLNGLHAVVMVSSSTEPSASGALADPGPSKQTGKDLRRGTPAHLDRSAEE